MATSVFAQQATITAGTPLASPMTVDISIPSNQIDIIRWRVPPGPRGNLGWQLTMGGALVIPEQPGTYIVADNEYDDWTISGLPDSGAWQVTGYNTGSNNHTVYLYFHVTPIALVGTTGGDITAGFPQSEADIPTMFTT